MELSRLRLRDLSTPIRVALTCICLVIGGGYVASLYYMWHHVGQKDDEAGVTLIDIVGTYHGVDRPSRILVALGDEAHRSEYLAGMTDDEYAVLQDWLALPDVAAIQQRYDELPDEAPEEALAPADVLDERCVRCHRPGAEEGGGIGSEIPLHNLPVVERFAYAKRLEPISVDILAQSTHAHALSIPVFTLIACGLLLGTCWPRRFRHGVIMICCVGLLLDFSGMWLARMHEGFVWCIIVGGGLYGIGLSLALAGSVVSMWFGRSEA